jgi:hypothetical protein
MYTVWLWMVILRGKGTQADLSSSRINGTLIRQNLLLSMTGANRIGILQGGE